MSAYEIAGGSVAGTEHVRIGKNNQDAYVWIETEDVLVAAVADGCGSGAYSEVGARIGVRLVTESLVQNAHEFLMVTDKSMSAIIRLHAALYRTERDVLKSLRELARDMGGNFSDVVREYFLFTVVGALITPVISATFEFGDGVIAINNAVIPLPQTPDNAPPYIGYKLLHPQKVLMPNKQLRFFTRWAMTEPVARTLLIGTDGALDFIAAEEKNLPGKDERLGPLGQFWTNGRYFKNPDMMRRRLAQANKPSLAIDWEKQETRKEQGLLPDDTTLVVIRQKTETNERG